MLKVGLTGGIGSGKSTVAGIFEVLGIPIYYADHHAKRLMHDDVNLRNAIVEHFGPDAFLGNILNSEFLASIVFNDPLKLEILNSLVHPAILKDMCEWESLQTSAYIIKEAALIFESGSNKTLDLIIGVRSTFTLQVSRTMARDNISKEQVLNRMAAQLPEEDKLSLCDYVILNDDTTSLTSQVLSLHNKFKNIVHC